MLALSISVAEIGLPAALGILLLMDAGVPIPIPTDLLLLVVGERAAAGAFPVWAAALGFEVIALVSTAALFLALRGPAGAVITRVGPRLGLTESRMGWAQRILERRGRGFLAMGRGTPGLRTLTVFTAAVARLRPVYALPAMALGSSVFLQGHLVLGYLFGPLADRALQHAALPIVIGVAAFAGLALVLFILRRGSVREGAKAWTEASCPACLALGALVGSVEPQEQPA